jgi:CelD/BcsL family acetyltransferase involved in cellulose biosynthesis
MNRYHTRLSAPCDLSEKDKMSWLALLAQQPLWQSPLLRPEFCQALYAHRRDLVIGIIYHHDNPVLFFPHHRSKGRAIRPAGAPLSDYMALITTPDPGFSWAKALTLLGIQKMPVMGVLDPYGLCQKLEQSDVKAMMIDTNPLLAQSVINKKLQKNINRLTRNLIANHGELEWVFDDRDPAVYDTMVRIKRDQYKDQGRHDYLASPWINNFMSSLFNEPNRNSLHGCLFSLKVKGVPILMHYGPRYGPVMHAWISSYNPDFSAYSPGQIFLNQCSEILRLNGIDLYDLSTGAEHYKSQFATKTVTVQAGQLLSDSANYSYPHQWLRYLPNSLQLTMQSINDRIDHIAAVEPDLKGRVKGIMGMTKVIPAHLKGLRRSHQ